MLSSAYSASTGNTAAADGRKRPDFADNEKEEHDGERTTNDGTKRQKRMSEDDVNDNAPLDNAYSSSPSPPSRSSSSSSTSSSSGGIPGRRRRQHESLLLPCDGTSILWEFLDFHLHVLKSVYAFRRRSGGGKSSGKRSSSSSSSKKKNTEGSRSSKKVSDAIQTQADADPIEESDDYDDVVVDDDETDDGGEGKIPGNDGVGDEDDDDEVSREVWDWTNKFLRDRNRLNRSRQRSDRWNGINDEAVDFMNQTPSPTSVVLDAVNGGDVFGGGEFSRSHRPDPTSLSMLSPSSTTYPSPHLPRARPQQPPVPSPTSHPIRHLTLSYDNDRSLTCPSPYTGLPGGPEASGNFDNSHDDDDIFNPMGAGSGGNVHDQGEFFNCFGIVSKLLNMESDAANTSFRKKMDPLHPLLLHVQQRLTKLQQRLNDHRSASMDTKQRMTTELLLSSSNVYTASAKQAAEASHPSLRLTNRSGEGRPGFHYESEQERSVVTAIETKIKLWSLLEKDLRNVMM